MTRIEEFINPVTIVDLVTNFRHEKSLAIAFICLGLRRYHQHHRERLLLPQAPISSSTAEFDSLHQLRCLL